jgi:hypothetical protein
MFSFYHRVCGNLQTTFPRLLGHLLSGELPPVGDTRKSLEDWRKGDVCFCIVVFFLWSLPQWRQEMLRYTMTCSVAEISSWQQQQQ